jgi:hypothetical protein
MAASLAFPVTPAAADRRTSADTSARSPFFLDRRGIAGQRLSGPEQQQTGAVHPADFYREIRRKPDADDETILDALQAGARSYLTND